MSLFRFKNAQIEYWQSNDKYWVAPTVLFLNGFADPFQNHLDLLNSISQRGYNIYAINLPGHGSSDFMPNLTVNVLVEIVDEFVRLENLSRVVIFGYSLGGGVALAALNQRLEWISELKLIAPMSYDFVNPDVHTMLIALRQSIHLAENRLPPLTQVNIKSLLTHYYKISDGFNYDLTQNSKPVNVLLMEHDTIIPVAVSKLYLQKIQNVEITELPNLGHSLVQVTKNNTELILDKLFPRLGFMERLIKFFNL
jgi:pimeloyl-ACP methyl ester carboxylesterase